MAPEKKNNDVFISTNKKLLDIPFIHQYLTSSYWSPGIPLKTVKKAIRGSQTFGVYINGDQQIGFARLITDKATFAYLADVFIVEKYRGQGNAKKLMEFIIAHPDCKGLRRILLATKDAHGLYRQYGFSPLNNVDRWMQIHHPEAYKVK